MHILILPSEEFIPDNAPTAGIFQYHQAKALQDAGHKIGVISIRQSFSYFMIAKGFILRMFGKKVGNSCDQYSLGGLLKLAYRKRFRVSDFINREIISGIEVWRVDGFFYRPPVENKNHKGWIKAGLAAIEGYIQSNGKPDVVHAHNAIYAGMLAKSVKSKYNVPFVLTEHNTAFARNTIVDAKIIQRIKNAYAAAAVLTAVSEPFCRFMNQRFSMDRFQCLHNVLDPDFERREFSVVPIKHSEFVFVNIAELHPKKDHIGLIDGFKKLYERRSDARLWIGGGGDLIEVLKEKVVAEGLEGVVSLLGPLSRDQVFDALRTGDCFVLPSKYETFGVVAIESMLMGKPVVATRCGGPESFITPQTGIVIDKEDATQLADAMQSVMTNAAEYNSEVIRRYAIANFGAAAFVSKAEAFFKQAIGLNENKKKFITKRQTQRPKTGSAFR